MLCAAKRDVRDERELEEAAASIQKVFRGRKQREEDKARRAQEAREQQQASIKMQAVFRGCKDRKVGAQKRQEKALAQLRHDKATQIQAWWRALQAKEMVGLLKEMEGLNLIQIKSRARGARGPANAAKGDSKRSQARSRPPGSAGVQRPALVEGHLQAEAQASNAQEVSLAWVQCEQLRAEHRRIKLGLNMAGGGKGEMGRIYLNPTGPQGKGSRGPRSKRMFVPLPATQRAAQVMSDVIAPFAPSDPNSWSKAGSSRHYNQPDVSSVGVVMSNHYEPPHGHRHNKNKPISFPELNREQGSNYTPRTSTYTPEELSM